jgi:hypothetical protein
MFRARGNLRALLQQAPDRLLDSLFRYGLIIQTTPQPPGQF